ncbi:MAG: 4Fe-4S dicluster domain-containing protein [Candidatus Glassbacteria bacterium]
MGENSETSTCRRDFLKAGVLASASALALVAAPRPLRAKPARTATNRWAMVIDLRRCIGCLACVVACKSEYNDPLGYWRTAVQLKDDGEYPEARRHITPVLCNHCEKPPCVEVCPVDPVERTFEDPIKGTMTFEGKATYKRPDGTVLVDENICVGCGMCIEACPYGARFFHPMRQAGGAPENKTIGKCTFCSHRIAHGVVPSCVNTCQGKARIFGDMNDPGSEVSRLLKKHRTKVLLPGKGTGPNNYYIGLEEGVYAEYGEEGRFHNEIK